MRCGPVQNYKLKNIMSIFFRKANVFYYFEDYFYLYVCIYIYVGLMTHVCRGLERPEGDIGSTGAGVIGGCEPRSSHWPPECL